MQILRKDSLKGCIEENDDDKHARDRYLMRKSSGLSYCELSGNIWGQFRNGGSAVSAIYNCKGHGKL